MMTELISYVYILALILIGGILIKFLFEYYNERRYFGVGFAFMGVILAIYALAIIIIRLSLSSTTFNINIL